MRVLIWHGWLLEGSGSNVYAARVSEVLRSEGHDVALVCQEGHPERYPWIDAWGTVGPDGVSSLTANAASPGAGRCVLLRPEIGTLLPVFVFDEYEGFEVKTFVDLRDDELDRYVRRNVEALRAAAMWHGTEVAIAGHAVPGAVVAKRAFGPGRFATKIHGSDIEYALRPQARYRELAGEGLRAARVVVGPSADVLERCAELVAGIGATHMIPPGVDVRAFRPRSRGAALIETAGRLDADPETWAGRPGSQDVALEQALARRDAERIDGLAMAYPQTVPDPGAAARLRELAARDRPVVGYLGKLIPQKGVELLIAAASLSQLDPEVLVVGFGLHREWIAALALALRGGDVEAVDWLRDRGGVPLELSEGDLARRREYRVTFTGRLDHRYAPGVLAAMDVLVVPSILAEAFAMVTVEGAAAGALPLVARHSGLAEVAASLEGAVGRPGLFSFAPGPGAVRRVSAGIDNLLSLPRDERDDLRREVSRFAAREWSWERTASRLLEVAR